VRVGVLTLGVIAYAGLTELEGILVHLPKVSEPIVLTSVQSAGQSLQPIGIPQPFKRTAEGVGVRFEFVSILTSSTHPHVVTVK